MNRLSFLFVILIFCSIGCRKEYPVPSRETPVFFFNGIVNGSPLTIQAGVDNYYMYSSFKQDAKNVYSFLGELKPVNCVNCNNKIKFQINDFTVSPLNGSTQIETSLIPAYYSLKSDDSLSFWTATNFVVNFNSIPSAGSSAVSYVWDFGDGITSLQSDPIHTYSHPGYYTTCLTITNSNGCVSSICNQIKVGVADDASIATIDDSIVSGNTIFLTGIGTFSAATYKWDFGDGAIYTSSINTVQHTYSNPGTYKVLLQIEDSNNKTASIYKNVSTQNFAGCVTNFDFTWSAKPNPLALSDVTLFWTDQSGVVFTSNNIFQAGDSYFQIVSVDNYSNNEKNQTTKKLHVKFKCNLSDGKNFIKIDNGEAVIAVSYQ